MSSSTASFASIQAVAFGGNHANPVFILIAIVFIVIVGALTVFRLRRGGPGPGVQGWLPRSMRGKVNKQYEEHGWQKPYDDDGNRNPDRDSF